MDDGACPTAEQSDEIACTVDVCSAEAGAWAHIPNNSLCEAGQACSPTAGCVAAGALTGTARLVGETDHTGITVTVDGLEGATTTTAADGSWTIAVPPGTYTVSYGKEKYVTKASGDILVLAEAAERAPDVELWRGEVIGDHRVIQQDYSVYPNPDNTYIIERVPTAFGNTVYARPSNEAGEPVELVSNPNDLYVTKTHVVWTAGGAIWSRPLTGATPAVQIGQASTTSNDYFNIVTQPGAYTLWFRQRYTGTVWEYSLWSAKTDGTGSVPTAPLWSAADNMHSFSFAVATDTTAVFGIHNNSNPGGVPNDGQQPLYRVDLATSTVTPVVVGASNEASYHSVSPDGKYIHGYVRQFVGFHWYRGFMMSIEGTTTPTLGPDYGPSSGTKNSDRSCNNLGWYPDSSGVVFTGCAYYTGAGYLNGDVKVWFTNAALPTTLVPQNNSLNAFSDVTVVGKAVVYRDPTNNVVRLVSAHSASPQAYVLDGSGNRTILNQAWVSTSATTGYVVWTQGMNASSPQPLKLMATSFTLPLASTPTTGQLGSNLPATCIHQGVLVGTSYYSLCAETATLTGYAQGAATASGSTTGVVGSLTPLTEAGRIAYRKTDGFHSATATFGATQAHIASKVDQNSDLHPVGNWVIYSDALGNATRASTADGTTIDSALFSCDALDSGTIFLDSTETQLWTGSARCARFDYKTIATPVANLP